MTFHNFDPYEELVILKHNVNVLIQETRKQEQLLLELTNQHKSMVDLVRRQSQLIQDLQQRTVNSPAV